MNLNEMAERAYKNSRAHGFHDGDHGNCIPEKLALIHAEVSEALEDYRNRQMSQWVNADSGKPNGFPSELADIVIRVGDLAVQCGIDLESAVLDKMDYNESRPYKHGGKKC